MEDNKDHIGAAVRALPSDLTEREQIDLLCHVETYMSITDKHSQTAPEAMAEETRMYSLVNGLIAKRFSNIGAAVRGEAVAECREDGRCQYAIDHGAEGMGHCPVDKCCMPVSARAADALDSQPTEPYPWLRAAFTTAESGADGYFVKFRFPTLQAMQAAHSQWIFASSQPTDGGVRNGSTVTDEQINAVARALSDRYADRQPADRGEIWNMYSSDFLTDAVLSFAAAGFKKSEGA